MSATSEHHQGGVNQNVNVNGNNNWVYVIAGDLIWLRTLRYVAALRKKRAAAGVLAVTALLRVFVVGAPLYPPVHWDYGQTALCRDRSFSGSQGRAGTCSSHGGVAFWRYEASDAFYQQPKATEELLASND